MTPVVEVEHEQLRLCLLADGVAQALPAVAGGLDPSVGHRVDAPDVDVVDDHSADVELAVGLVDDLQVAAEDPGLKAVLGRVGLLDEAIGRQRISAKKERLIQALLDEGLGMLRVARMVKVGTGTVQRVAKSR